MGRSADTSAVTHSKEIEPWARPRLSGLVVRPHAEPWPHGTCMELRDPVLVWMPSCDGGVE